VKYIMILFAMLPVYADVVSTNTSMYFKLREADTKMILSESGLTIGDTIGSSNLFVNGTFATSIALISTDTDINLHSKYIVDVSSANVTLTAPDPTIYQGREISIKRKGSGNIDLVSDNGKLIDNVATYTMTSSDNYLTMKNDGNNWWVISKY